MRRREPQGPRRGVTSRNGLGWGAGANDRGSGRQRTARDDPPRLASPRGTRSVAEVELPGEVAAARMADVIASSAAGGVHRSKTARRSTAVRRTVPWTTPNPTASYEVCTALADELPHQIAVVPTPVPSMRRTSWRATGRRHNERPVAPYAWAAASSPAWASWSRTDVAPVVPRSLLGPRSH